MKTKHTKYEAVLMDGGILLKPGEWVSMHVDTIPTPSVPELLAWMGRLRAAFLSESFNLENDLIHLILMNEFGPDGIKNDRNHYSSRDLELRSLHSLEKLIDKAKSIARTHLGDS